MSITAVFEDLPVVAEPASLPLPTPQPFGAPVVISDCSSPLAGETLLSLLWKRLDQARGDPD